MDDIQVIIFVTVYTYFSLTYLENYRSFFFRKEEVDVASRMRNVAININCCTNRRCSSACMKLEVTFIDVSLLDKNALPSYIT